MTYRTLTIADLAATPDGTLVLVTGTYARSVTGATLSDADATIELSGEPFDWSPRHDTRLDVWGQLRNGPAPRLIVHNARLPGDVRRHPRSSPTAPAGTTLTVTARVQRVGADLLAVTPDRHTYLLRGRDLPDGYHHLTGTLIRESPPLLDLTSHHDLSRAMLPPTEVPQE
ncbi:hypothetical protein CBQ26_19610 [Deinococcus indicus]|uniref:Uncharacterized protein n=1 Tax=Deinococcus indicus TaxID=223556 RepID=A0A246BEL2_9DEIO|nr:hypothetical protein [Deinococcus indicus]OWL93186.1 hypothetical protein CBQ26_20860 [Deinococcus indicus]OWL93439.1 hypothetical protein CBQ26_19610 [Deinococcus indicus]